jgi:hypothetical protein
MTSAAQLQLAVWFTGICCIGSFAFLGWLLWSIGWDVYDHLMQQRKRRQNSHFDARVGRDAYRFTKGVHHQ